MGVGNRGTSVTAPFVPTPSGSRQLEVSKEPVPPDDRLHWVGECRLTPCPNGTIRVVKDPGCRVDAAHR